ncbi:hypothetical protein ACJZ2D_016572 [Fusarium nematophilum]
MFFLLPLCALAFAAPACAEVSLGQTVDITVHAGSLVGTGVIEFNSLHILPTTREDEAGATGTPEQETTPTTQCYKDFSKPMPPGWTRHDAPVTGTFHGEPHLYPDGCDKYVFKHAALPDPDQDMGAWYYKFR